MQSKTITILATFSFMMLSSAAYSHNFNSETCDVNLNGEIVLANNEMTITSEQDDVILFTKAGDASVNGKTLQLTSQERETVTSYVEGFEEAVPKAIELAAKAIELTNYALTEVFTGILGEDSKLPQMLNDKLSALQQKLENHVYQQPDSVTFNSAFFDGNSSEASEFERDIDAAVEEVMGTAMAELLVSFGRSMFSGDTNMENFEEKMTSLGDTIDATVTEQSQKLKGDALELCESLEKIEEKERELQKIKGLEGIDFVHVTPKRA
jgi:hypothetical protein